MNNSVKDTDILDISSIEKTMHRQDKLERVEMTGWEFLRSLHDVCHFQTREGKKVGRASSSELKRWLQNNVVLVNGESLKWNERMDFKINSVVLFPKSNGRITLL